MSNTTEITTGWRCRIDMNDIQVPAVVVTPESMPRQMALIFREWIEPDVWAKFSTENVKWVTIGCDSERVYERERIEDFSLRETSKHDFIPLAEEKQTEQFQQGDYAVTRTLEVVIDGVRYVDIIQHR